MKTHVQIFSIRRIHPKSWRIVCYVPFSFLPRKSGGKQMIFRSKQLPLMRGLRFPKGGKCLGGGRETHNILFFVPLEWLARGLTPGTSVFLGKAFLHFGDRCKWKGSSRMKECKGIAALLGWALLRILFIGSNSRSPLRCVWCICLANNIPRFRSQIHSWFAAVIVLSIFSLSLPPSLYFPPPFSRGILSCTVAEW